LEGLYFYPQVQDFSNCQVKTSSKAYRYLPKEEAKQRAAKAKSKQGFTIRYSRV